MLIKRRDSIPELQNAIQRIYNHEDVKPTVAIAHALRDNSFSKLNPMILRY
jgi:hypothetical protein